MPGLTSAAGLIGLLDEPDTDLRNYALQQLDVYVHQFWPEIADEVSKIEAIYEDESFKQRKLAALVVSKVYYHLGEYDDSMMFALGAGELFNITAKEEYVDTIISKCIDEYIAVTSHNYNLEHNQEPGSESQEPKVIDSRLQDIVERMFRKCYEEEDYKPAIGIAIEAKRLDVVEEGIKLAGSRHQKLIAGGDTQETDMAVELMEYVLDIAMVEVEEISLRESLLRMLVTLFTSLSTPDYFSISKCVIHLNDTKLAAKMLKDLVSKGDSRSLLVAYQIAFDLDSSATQKFLRKVIEGITGKKEGAEEECSSTVEESETATADNEDPVKKHLKAVCTILRGTKSIELSLEFLFRNNKTDMQILNKIKDSLEARTSIFHTALTFANAFMHSGTMVDKFFRDNLDWLSKAVNWSKFTATAALGVIHKGNLSQGMKLLQPYLPQEGVTTGSPYSQGGSLYGLGLIYANHGTDVLDFLRNQFNATQDEIVQHGGALGLGVAGMATGRSDLYEELKVVLWSDSAVAGEAVGLGMGLVMLGTGNATALEDMTSYARETQHEKIIRGLAIGMALIMFGKQEAADELIKTLLDDQDPILRYGGIMTIAMAYCGTGSNKAIRKLLHVAVSDVNDDVRRVAVMSLGFILFRKPSAVPRMVELLSESYNPHVRYGAAMALGIACAGTGLDEAIDLLEPMMKDPADFVRQGALISMAMILIQQNEQMKPKVAQIRKAIESTMGDKHEDAMAKFGAALALGIIDAGGRNVTIGLQTPTGSLNVPAIVGMAVFTQYWYWFPLTHFLTLSFTPTGLIGLDENLNIPDFKFWSNTRPSLFDYPPKVEEVTEKKVEEFATAVLSTTIKAQQRAKRAEKEKATKEAEKSGDLMDIEPTTPATPALAATEKMDVDEEKDEKKEGEEEKKEGEADKKKRVEKEKVGYEVSNMSRVLPDQWKYISFLEDGRYEPVKKPSSGILLLLDRKPEEEVKLLEIKSRKPATTTAAAPAAGAAAAVAAAAEIGGAEAAVGVLNLEDDDGTDDAPLPDPFEYVTDSED
ncbi:armadillo-type protein [Pyronema domesticum]|uniref:26S proteasome regulatory subunit RPN2 n=1 Tax=Pyronema omphalodes (strain CBS 100304) TaxID=1076935 RepID=U4LMG3_PYROM|nr:armadillo-type protein [Pyronema domesticum]CCX33138.1 Similar to 26S proteasome regulatory subunit rpn2; acc. no. O74762 [Pyronema omphalodes CBS 100304]